MCINKFFVLKSTDVHYDDAYYNYSYNHMTKYLRLINQTNIALLLNYLMQTMHTVLKIDVRSTPIIPANAKLTVIFVRYKRRTDERRRQLMRPIRTVT